jgi:hypothetical protein
MNELEIRGAALEKREPKIARTEKESLELMICLGIFIPLKPISI